MTDPRKDDHLDEDLKALSAAYRAASDAVPGALGPPPALDDAIRAAARRAVKAGPQPVARTWFSRSSTPLAAAAVLVLTVSIGFLSLDDPKIQVKSKLDDLGMAQPSSQKDQAKLSAPPAEPAPPVEPKPKAGAQARIEEALPSAPPPPPKSASQRTEREKQEAAPGAIAQAPVSPPPALYVPTPPAPAAPAAAPAPAAPPSYEPPPAALTHSPVAAPAPAVAPAPIAAATPPSPPTQPSDALGRKRADTAAGIRGLAAEDPQARSEKPTAATRAANRPDYEAVIVQSQPAKPAASTVPAAPAEPKRERPAPASIPQSVGEVRAAKQKEQPAVAKQFAADPPSGGLAARDPAEASGSVAISGSRVRVEEARAKKDAVSMDAAKRQSEAERAGADKVAAEKFAEKTARAAAESDTALTAEDWIKRILELRKQGKTQEAADELRKFRKRYPDYSLPPELRDAK
jgi:hypothetical protein